MRYAAFLFGLCLAVPAFAGESLEKTTVTFASGATYVFVPFDMAMNGTSIFHVTRDGKPAPRDYFDGAELRAENDGEIGCFDLFYDASTDLLSCTEKNGYRGWFADYFRDDRGRLKLVRAVQLDLDDGDTPADEEKTTTLYEAK